MKLSIVLVLVCVVLVHHWLGINGSSHKRKTKTKTPHLSKKSKYVAKKQSTSLLTMTESTPSGMTSVKSVPSGSSLTAVTGDGTTDDTSAIQAFIDHVAGTSDNKLFFPPGEYLISDNILLGGSVELYGSVDGMSVLKTTAAMSYKVILGSVDASVSITNVVIKNLFFNGLRVQFSGARKLGFCHSALAATREEIKVTENVFFSSVTPSGAAMKGQILFQRPKDSEVTYNVFLRASNAFGVGSQFCRTENVKIKHNIFGLELTKIDWIGGTDLGSTTFWTKQKEKLQFLKTHYTLLPDQGYIKSSIYGTLDKDMVIEKNVFNGSPNTAGSLHKDHVVYVKGFDGMKILRNYARGWPADPSGSIKARNAKNLVIARNYIDGSGIIIYSHDAARTPYLYGGLKNVVIYGNRIVERTNLGGTKSGIAYWEPKGHGPGVDENIRYSANEFEFPTESDPSSLSYDCIFLANGNLAEHHVYQDNVFHGTSTKVGLDARTTASFESGDIDSSISTEYSYGVFKLTIPTY